MYALSDAWHALLLMPTVRYISCPPNRLSRYLFVSQPFWIGISAEKSQITALMMSGKHFRIWFKTVQIMCCCCCWFLFLFQNIRIVFTCVCFAIKYAMIVGTFALAADSVCNCISCAHAMLGMHCYWIMSERFFSEKINLK